MCVSVCLCVSVCKCVCVRDATMSSDGSEVLLKAQHEAVEIHGDNVCCVDAAQVIRTPQPPRTKVPPWYRGRGGGKTSWYVRVWVSVCLSCLFVCLFVCLSVCL